MVFENSELRLEVGEGLYFPILGNPEINDQLNSHGATCTLQVRVAKGATLPREGSLAFLTRLLGATRSKVFGGICGEVTPNLGVAYDTVSLTLNNYTDYTKRKQISNYRRTSTIADHVLQGATLSGATLEGVRQLLQIVVNASTDTESFLFEFERGDYSQFLDQLCTARNYSWTIRDTGALTIADLSTYNAILTVNSNSSLVDSAPVSELSIPEPGEALTGVFWQANTLTYKIIEPIASKILLLGKNGENIPASGDALLNPDTRRYIALDGQTEYKTSETADEIIKVIVTKPSMAAIEFTKVLFADLADPSNPIPTAGSNQAVIRPEEFLIYVNSTDVPEGSLVQILHITRFIKAEAESATAIAYFKSVASNAGSGEKIHLEIREDITDQVTAQALADSLKAVLCAFNFLISFGCLRYTGWKAGQQFTASHPARDLSFLVTIQNVKIKLRPGGRDFYSIDAGTIRIMSESDAQAKILDRQANPIKPRLPFATAGLYTG